MLTFITTDRLEIVYPTQADLPFLYPLYTDPKMMIHLGGPISAKSVEARISRWQDHWRKHGFGIGVVRLKATGEPVGTIGGFLRELVDETALEVGWMVALSHHGKGIATEALQAIVKYARTHLSGNPVVAFPGSENAGSNRLCEKLGFKKLGRVPYPFEKAVLQSNYWRLDPE